ncbi:MAG: hypothetical protein K1060chlam2_00495 [Chlamydiae bacterium]|nr:hypothetical protein [Chlamydiota bacterium]
MKGFISQLFVFFLLLLVGIAEGHSVQVEFNLTSQSEEDEDISILKEFLFYHIHSQITQDRSSSYTLSPDQGGNFSFEGTQDQLDALLGRFSHRLEMGFTREEFIFAKENFLQELESSGALFERSLAEEINWEHLPEGQEPMREMVRRLKKFRHSEVQLMRAANPKRVPPIQPFYSLRLNETDQKNIEKLIKNLADWNVVKLLMKKREMEKLGDKIRPVHPLRFLGYIHSRHDLKSRLSKIRGNHFKWKNFLGGLRERMVEESRKNNVHRYIPGFSHLTGVSHPRVLSTIRQSNWEALILGKM